MIMVLFNYNSLKPMIKSSPKLIANILNASMTFYQNPELKVPMLMLKEKLLKLTPKPNWHLSLNRTVSKF